MESFLESPVTGVWEITMGCNMRCRHCGSGCEKPLPDELTTDEALKLAKEIAGLGMRWLTLSGGEPLLRKDWHLIAQALTAGGVTPNIITNGWYLTPEMVDKALASGVGVLAVSLDGVQATHDFMRQEGSYQRVMDGLRLMAAKGQAAGVITTVTSRNLPELPQLGEALVAAGVASWQLQIGLPMGNLGQHREELPPPEAIDQIIDFAYATTLAGRIKVFPADCVGYFSLKELETRRLVYGSDSYPLWQGCNAGKRSLGILHNGDILGCTSIRSKAFIEGNVRERPLAEIWRDPQSFRWNRAALKSGLGGNCRVCQYGDQCQGGCPNTRLTMNGQLQSDNAYCSYNLRLAATRQQLQTMRDGPELLDTGMEMVRQGNHQLGAMTLERALELQPDHLDGWRHLGFAHFTLNNHAECAAANRQVLAQTPDDPYARKGLGLALHRLGQTEEGLTHLRQAVANSAQDDWDARHDLAVVLMEAQRPEEAQAVLARAT